jgi:hypothetical protein
MIGDTAEYRGLAGTARTVTAGRKYVHAGVFQNVKNGAIGRDPEGHSRLGELNLE